MQPAEEYRRRAEARHLEAAALAHRSNLIGNLRLAVFALGVVCAWLALSRHLFSPWWLLVLVAAFVALIELHDRVIAQQHGAEKAAAVYRRGLARIEDRWAGTGATGESFRAPDHVFAEDLDLFGRGSLFELLSTARTPLGEETLASWLLHPAALPVVVERQRGVAELRDNLDLREQLATSGSDVAAPQDPAVLLAWAEDTPPPPQRIFRVLAAGLMVLAIAAAAFGLLSGVWTPLIAVVAIEAALAWRWRKRIEASVGPVSGATADLALVSVLLDRLERESFASPRLRALAEGLVRVAQEACPERSERAPSRVGEHPSRAMSRLKTLANFADSRHNMLVRFLDVPLMYSLQLALTVDSWRRRHGQSVRRWLEALAEMEALESLAAYSYEHPDDPFPEFVAPPAPHITPEVVSSRESRVVNSPGLGARDSGLPLADSPGLGARDLGLPLADSPGLGAQDLGLPLADVGDPPVFVGDDLGHPLLPAAQCVRNGIALGSPVQVLLVSGSNMSGKSTFLRTVGINAVLAMAGAPVRARSLRLTPLALGTAIRVTDSLQAGRSGFFAEITRLRQIMDLTVAGLPVLFLLDELLHGTNSHDRRIGAEALVRALIERGAIGVVTTHDLALTAIGTAGVDGRVRNAHFQDELRDGRMLFDYRLHDGVVTHSNALELMRSVGLDV